MLIIIIIYDEPSNWIKLNRASILKRIMASYGAKEAFKYGC